MDVGQAIFIYIPWFLFIGVTILYIIDFIQKKYVASAFRSKENKIIKRLEERDKAFNATAALNAIVLETLDFNEAIQKVTNALPQYLGYEIGVLALVDESRGVLKRVGLSNTSGSVQALKVLEIPFTNIDIKLTDTENWCVKAIYEKRSYYTNNLYNVLRPTITPENAKLIQEKMGTKTTLIFPIYSKDNKPIGTFLISMSKTYDQISEYEHQTIRNFIDSIRIVLDNASLYTSVVRITEDLKNANERLQELDKLKSEFVSVASHELRTPMTAIKSYLWMALDGRGGPLTDKQRYYLDRSYSSVDRLIKLVNDMLNISRIESGRLTIEMKKVDLLKLVNEVVEEVTPRAQELGVHVLAEQQELPHVLADSDKIKEVVFNLVGNSMKFTPKDGTITVSFIKNNNMIETVVKDTGVGILKEDIRKLFQKFGLVAGSYTTNQAVNSGTGLGLYISKSIIELHEGNISVESEGKGKGARFMFSLKVYNEEDFKRLNAKYQHEDGKVVEIIHTKF